MDEGQVKGEGKTEKARRMRGRGILLLLLALVSAAVVLWAFLERVPSREAQAAALLRRGDFCEYVCDDPDPSLSGPRCGQEWVRVNWVMESSGCPQGDGECWTTWARSKPRAWYECLPRVDMKKGEGDGTPPAGFSPYTVVDPRAKCNDENCEEKWAAGTWYVNAVARPVFPDKGKWENGMCVYRCTWTIDPSHFYWFFGERGYCYACNVCIVPPTATPGATPPATPKPTECTPGPPTPPPTPVSPPTPTPIPGPSDVRVSPLVYLRSPRTQPDEGVGGWHILRTDRFYWLWQLQLHIRPWAEVTYVSPPDGCEVRSYEVTGIYIEEVGPENWSEGERRVCPPPDAPSQPVAPKNTVYGDRSLFCGWRGEGEDYAMRLLWSRQEMRPRTPHALLDASLNQYDITPWTQKWVLIRYRVRVHVSYTCGEFTTGADVYAGPITLHVGLVKPVRQYIPPSQP